MGYEVGADCLWWRTALERDFYVQDDSLRPKDHPPGAVPRVTYAAWHRAARELRLDPAGRAQRVPWRCVDLWRRMRLWASANAPWLVRTLRLGEMRHAAPWDAVCREGEGVVGLFPIMNDDGWLANEVSDPHGDYGQAGQQPAPFVYQSCSGQFPGGGQGTFGGEVTFVPGTMNAPCGEPFRVRVGPFPLTIPEVVI